jgi:hypothetical protein
MTDEQIKELKLRVFVNDVNFNSDILSDKRSFGHKHYPRHGRIELSIRPNLLEIPEGINYYHKQIYSLYVKLSLFLYCNSYNQVFQKL